MKKFIFAVALLATAANANDVVRHEEEVLIKEIKQTINLMPPIRPRLPVTYISIEVMSNGCTKPEDFQVQTTLSGFGQWLTIKRIEPDFCRGLQRRETIELVSRNVAHTRLFQVTVVNPLLVELLEAH